MPHQTAPVKRCVDGSREDGSEAYGLNFPWQIYWEKENPALWLWCFKYLIPFPFILKALKIHTAHWSESLLRAQIGLRFPRVPEK